MEDILPDISVRTDCTPARFLRRMELIARRDDTIVEVRRDRNVAGSRLNIVAVKPVDQRGHRNLIVQLIAQRDRAGRIAVETRAATWHPDPPSYDAYVTAATAVMNPLLSKYNSRYNSRRRLRIQSKTATEPALPPGATKYFERFCALANTFVLHPLDWQRFYRFVRFCHLRRVRIAGPDVERLLVKNGFSADYAARISQVFDHGRALLRTHVYPYG